MRQQLASTWFAGKNQPVPKQEFTARTKQSINQSINKTLQGQQNNQGSD